MSYKRSPFKMAPKSPLTKALKGNQGKLPQHLQEAIKAAPESPAKAMQGPPPKTSGTLSKSISNRSYAPSTAEGQMQAKFDTGKKAETSSSNKTGTTASPSAPKRTQRSYAPGTSQSKFNPEEVKPKANKPKADKPTVKKPKYDKELNSLVASRKGLKKGTAEYNKVQNRINEKLGSSVRRREEKATVIAPKKKKATAAPKVNTALPAKPSAPAASGKTAKPAKKNSPRVTQTANRATVVTKSNGVKKRETINKNTGNKKVVVKDANTRTVTKTNKAGESTTKTTKRIGKGRIKGAIKNARLARLDKKATRQAEKAADKKSKGADKLSGLSGAKSPAKNYKKGYYGK